MDGNEQEREATLETKQNDGELQTNKDEETVQGNAHGLQSVQDTKNDEQPGTSKDQGTEPKIKTRKREKRAKRVDRKPSQKPPVDYRKVCKSLQPPAVEIKTKKDGTKTLGEWQCCWYNEVIICACFTVALIP